MSVKPKDRGHAGRGMLPAPKAVPMPGVTCSGSRRSTGRDPGAPYFDKAVEPLKQNTDHRNHHWRCRRRAGPGARSSKELRKP